MAWREVAYIVLGSTLLFAFQLYGIAELVRNEPPRGTLIGMVYSDRTLAPIPNAFVRLERVEPPPEAPSLSSELDMPYRRQGWQPKPPESVVYPFAYQAWETCTDARGRFQLRGIPAGVYRVYIAAKVHHLSREQESNLRIVVREGERTEVELPLVAADPFLELIHPQAVYYPDEPLRVGVRGFHEEDRLQLTLYRARYPDREQPPLELHNFLSDLRHGWWSPNRNALREQLERFRPYLLPVWQQATPVRGRDPEGVHTQYLELPRQPEGTYVLTIEAGDLIQAALVSVSSIGVVAKSGGGTTEVWCTDLRTGQPIANAEVRVYARSSGDESASVRQVAVGRTNAQGLWRLQTAPLAGERWYKPMVAVHAPRTGALIHWGRLGVGADYAPESTSTLAGTIYPERPIYRPGDTMHLKGVVRTGNAPNYELLPPNTPVRITIFNPRDELVYETRTALNPMSSFHFDFRTSPEAEAGYYRVIASVGNYGQLERYVPLSAYRKPTYRVHLKTDKPLYMPRSVVRAEIHTEYYFGMPVPNTTLNYFVYRREKFTWSDDYGGTVDYLEGDEEWLDGEPENYGQVIETGQLTTDAMGRAVLTLRTDELLPQPRSDAPSGLDEPSFAYEYTIEVFAISEGWEGAKAAAQFEVVPSVWEARFVPDAAFGEAKRTYRYRVQLTDRRTGQPVPAELRWQAGKYLWAGNRPRYEVFAEGTIATSAQGVGSFEFTPDHSGDWYIRVVGRDSEGNRVVASHWLWIWDTNYIPWWFESAQQRNALEVRLQKRHYEPGESAELALRTPHTDATFYITLEGDTIYHSQVVKAQGALTRVRVPLSHQQVPNAYVSVCMVREKQLIERVVEIKVGARYGRLTVTVETDKSRYQPGEMLTARIRTTDAQGRPVPAEVSLAVVDEAVYSIREDSPQDVFRAFYGRRYNRVYTDFSAVWLALQGDKGSVETVRREFPDTAYWQPTIMTDARGLATVRVRLPDNLTEWRLTAIGHTRDTQVGFARAHVKAAKDLMARLRLPLWLNEGDRTEISAILSNDTAQPRTVQVELRAPDGVRAQTVSVPAHGSAALHWQYEAKLVGTHKFTLVAREINGVLRDAEERTLEVKPLAIFETDARVVLLDGERQLDFTLPPDTQLARTTLTVRAIPSVGALIADSLQYLVDHPYGCIEQTVSRFVPAVIAQRALQESGITVDAEQTRKLAEAVEQGLQRLSRAQNSDGGWGWWEGSQSEPWLTAYVVWGLHKARQAGVSVSPAMYQHGVDALRRQIAHLLASHPERPETPVGGDTLFALQVLAEVDPTPPAPLQDERHAFYARLNTILSARPYPSQQHDRLTLIRILQRWRNLPNAERYLAELWQQALRDAYEDRNLIDWSPQRPSEYYWSEWLATEIQALALQALLKESPTRFGTPRRHEQLINKTVIGLLMGYREGSWYTSRDTALAVEALTDYLPRASKQLLAPEATYEVWLNGQKVRTLTLTREEVQVRRPAVVLRDLPWRTGENTVIVRSVRGTPLVSLALRQARTLNLRDADQPTGPLRMRLYRVERPADMSQPGERLRPLQSGEMVRVGELLRLDIEARLPRALPRMDYTMLETPFAAGCAPFDTEAFLRMWWWRYDFEEIRDDRAVAFRRYWSQGEAYRYSLLLRAETPGEYTILPAHLWGMYAPYRASSNGFKVRIVAR